MCNQVNHDPFAGFDDGSFDAELAAPAKPARANQHTTAIGGLEVPGFSEPCKKCRGTGTFRSFSGRSLGDCFACKGAGKLTFKTAPEARAKARKGAANRTAKAAADKAAAFAEFLKANPDVSAWLAANAGNDFAGSLLAAGAKYGSLTDGQVAAVRKAIARDADRADVAAVWGAANPAEWEWLTTNAAAGNEFAASLKASLGRFGSLTDGQLAAVRRNVEKAATGATEAAETGLDVSGLKGYFAVPDGDTRLKVCVRHPGKDSKNYGWVLVDDGAAYGRRQNYGKQAPGGLYRGRIADQLRAILADPLAAHIAYGKLTGSCGVCGKHLENAESVAAGIGPICAGKY